VKAHSDSPYDSVAFMVDANTSAVQSRLALTCSHGAEDVFSLTSHKETFLRAYQEYSDNVGQIEEDLCAYLKVCPSYLRPYSYDSV